MKVWLKPRLLDRRQVLVPWANTPMQRPSSHLSLAVSRVRMDTCALKPRTRFTTRLLSALLDPTVSLESKLSAQQAHTPLRLAQKPHQPVCHVLQDFGVTLEQAITQPMCVMLVTTVSKAALFQTPLLVQMVLTRRQQV